MAFDNASGGTLSYYSPHLLRNKGPDDNPRFNGTHDAVTSKREGKKEQGSPYFGGLPSTVASTATASSSTHERSKKRVATSATGDENEKRTKVGFLSAHFRWHSVGRLTIGLLERLSSSRSVEIVVIDASIDGWSSRAGRSSSPLQDISGEQWEGGDSAEDPIMKRLNAAGVSVVRLTAAAEKATAKPSDPAGGSDPAGEATADAAKHSNNGASNLTLESAHKTVAALKLDVLVYGDVGMDALTTGLAHGRLSPVQVAFWGHPGTTGLSTMDYFVTSDLFEGELGDGRDSTRARSYPRGGTLTANQNYAGSEDPVENFPEADAEDAAGVDGGNVNPLGGAKANTRQDAFSEQLVRLGGLGVLFDDPTQTFGWDPGCGTSTDLPVTDTLSRNGSHNSRESAPERGVAGEQQEGHNSGPVQVAASLSGESDGGDSPEVGAMKAAAAATSRPRLYVCAQSLMKMHPDFDAVLAGILAADPLAQILLLRDPRQLLWYSRFRRRLRTAVDAAERQAVEPPAATFDPRAADIANDNRSADPSSPLSRQLVSFWSRVHFLSPLSGREFFRLQCRADVVLDPIPFGGGVTTLEVSRATTVIVNA